MALGKIFELRGRVIIPKEDCYIIQPIKEMFDKYPEEHLKLCAYLHYMKSMKKEDNPYADVPLKDRSEQIVFDLQIETDVDNNDVIERALSTVEEMYYTTFYGLYKGIKSSLDKIGKALELVEIDFNQKDGNVGNITRIAKEYEALRSSFKAAYRDFDEETGNVRVRGNSRLAIDENDSDDDL